MKKNYFLLRIVLLCFLIATGWQSSFGQVGIGTTTPDANAALEINGDDGGLLMPRMALVSTGSSNPLSAHVAGMTVYNTATSGSGATQVTPGFYFNDGTRWVRISGSSDPKTAWELAGNTGTNPTDNFLGTIDNQAFNIRTNNLNRFQITTGNATTGGRLLAYTNGAAATPIYSWQANPGTGMYQQTANVLGFSTNGTERFRIPNANQVHGVNGGTAALPFYSWVGRTNTGMWSPANNTMAFSTNANEAMRIDVNRRVMINTTSPITNTRLTVVETGANRAIYGSTQTGTGEGVRGEASSTGTGVTGITNTGFGVWGASLGAGYGGNFVGQNNNAVGAMIRGGNQTGLEFGNSGTGAAVNGRLFGVTALGRAAISGVGVVGIGDGQTGIPVSRPSGVGVLGVGFQAGVYGESAYYGPPGIHGVGEGNPIGTISGNGVLGENVGGAGDGVFGNSTNVGVRGYGAHGAILESRLDNGFGAIAWNTTNAGTNRVGLVAAGQNLDPGGLSGSGATLLGLNSGGVGIATSNNSTGIYGGGNNQTTVYTGNNGAGVAGTGTYIGTFGTSTRAQDGIGVVGVGDATQTYTLPPVISGTSGAGVAGTGTMIGVFGHATNEAQGYGFVTLGDMYIAGDFYGPRGISTNQFSVNERGMTVDVEISTRSITATGDLMASGTKNFIIDHPNNPANQYLKHASVESNEILNMYRGTATFNSSGEVIVDLPDYYDAINKNPSYQLTPVGAAMPNLFIAEEVTNGRFTIAGGEPGKKVSWTITAERNDPYIQGNPEVRNMVVDKGENRGKYLTPEAYGKSKENEILNQKMTAIKEHPKMQIGEIQTVNMQGSEVQRFTREEIENQTMPFEKFEVQTGTEKRNVELIEADEVKVDNLIMEGRESGNTISPASEGGFPESSEAIQPSGALSVKPAENYNSFQAED